VDATIGLNLSPGKMAVSNICIMSAKHARPRDPNLWALVKRPTLDAITKIKLYVQSLETGSAQSDVQASVLNYGYKALFADPWSATNGTLYSATDLDGLAELLEAIESNQTILSKFHSPDDSDQPDENLSTGQGLGQLISMIPLVLADRYMMRNYRGINDDALVHLYLPQEKYLIEGELRGDIIVPIHGARTTKNYRFQGYSIVKATDEMRSIFSMAPDINPMDAADLGSFDNAMIIRDAPIDAVGCGFYFGAGPQQDGYDLIGRFFDGLNIAAPLNAWYIQLAVRPHGWIGYFQRPHGSVFSFTFRSYISRLETRQKFGRRMPNIVNSEILAGHEYGLALASCHPGVRVAAKRFMGAFDRSNDDDAIVDLCIALEAILGAGFGETVHRICLRAAAMLLRTGWTDSQDLYKAMRNTYAYRSKVVHGVPGPCKEEELFIDGTMVHAVRFATAALSALLELALSINGFDPNKVDEEFIFSSLNAAGSRMARPRPGERSV
jgi:hypothetical protein